MPGEAPAIDTWTAAALGALQGVAEFLPISSSGHLSMAQVLLGIDAEQGGHRFNIVVHAGTLLAVVWVYRADLWRLVRERGTTGRAATLAFVVPAFARRWDPRASARPGPLPEPTIVCSPLATSGREDVS